jgi:23S rRNA pseudouridine1911/1915/1917 synthase
MQSKSQPKRKVFFSAVKKTDAYKAKNQPKLKKEVPEVKSPKVQPKNSKKRSVSILTVAEPMELMTFLVNNLKDQSRTTIKSLLSHQQVTIKKQVIRQYNYQLKAGEEVNIHWGKGQTTLKDPQLKIIFEDKYLIVVEKAAGLLSIATQKERIRTAYSILSEYVKQQHPGNKIFVVHRLDRDTSGLMLFAKNQDVQYEMQSNWKYAVNQRKYTAVVEGKLETGDGSGIGTIKSYLWESKALIVYSSPNPEDGQEAITHYKVIKSSNEYSLVELELETGRKNQIRVQMNSIGYPLVGDLKYGGHPSILKRLALHANVLSFTHPVTGEMHAFETPVPAAFVSLVEKSIY